MAILFSDLAFIRSVDARAEELGFQLRRSRYCDGEIALMAINDEYPLYNRDAEMFQGTLEQISNFLHGMLWMRNYDQMLDKKNDEKRKKKEDVFRQRQLIRILKEQAKEELKE